MVSEPQAISNIDSVSKFEDNSLIRMPSSNRLNLANNA